eukprot:RCo041538
MLRPTCKLYRSFRFKSVRDPTILPQFGSEVTQRKGRHLLRMVAKPPKGWDPKPDGMTRMPEAWMKSGLSFQLCSMTDLEIRRWALEAIRPEVDKITQAELVPFRVEDLINFHFLRTSLHEKILDAAERIFQITILSADRKNITQMRQLIDWLIQRVQLAMPVPSYEIPQEIDLFLDTMLAIRVNKIKRRDRMEAVWQNEMRRKKDCEERFPKASADVWLTQYVKDSAKRVFHERAEQRRKESEEAEKAERRRQAEILLAERKAKAEAAAKEREQRLQS